MDSRGRELHSLSFGTVQCPKCNKNGAIKRRQIGGFQGFYIDHKVKGRWFRCYLRKATSEECKLNNKNPKDRLKTQLVLVGEENLLGENDRKDQEKHDDLRLCKKLSAKGGSIKRTLIKSVVGNVMRLIQNTVTNAESVVSSSVKLE